MLPRMGLPARGHKQACRSCITDTAGACSSGGKDSDAREQAVSSTQTARRSASSTMENGGAIVPVGVVKAALPEALVTQTRAIGVILPPPDIRAIVDKTVGARAAAQGRCGRAAAARAAAAAAAAAQAVLGCLLLQ